MTLELIWPGKELRQPHKAAALVEVPERAHGPDGDNRLIFGDNLPALNALGPEFAGKVQCVYIDPPYNTGADVTHYDDRSAHAVWLSALRDRLEALRPLLAPSGVVFVSIDDAEAAYLKVLMDEVFGRANFCGQLVWEKKRKPSFLDPNLGVVTEYVLAFARDRASAPPFIGGATTPGKWHPLNNAGNGLRTLEFAAGSVQFKCPDATFAPQDMSSGAIVTRLLDAVAVRAGRNVGAFRLEGEWRYSQATLDAVLASGGTIVISKAPFRPNHVRDGGKPKKLCNLLDRARGMPTYEDAAAESRALFGAAAFDYPKPERLIATLIGAVTRAGDWVLDAYAGSGTTGAVAQKLGRRWIMIEQGAHCHSHIIPRLQHVSAATGGGFRYFRLEPRDP